MNRPIPISNTRISTNNQSLTIKAHFDETNSFFRRKLPARYQYGGGGISATAKITFGKSGKILLSKPACELMALSSKDKISFAQSDEDPATWFLFQDQDGYQLQEGKRGNLILEHDSLVKSFIGTWDLPTDQNHRAALATEPTLIRKKKHWRLELQHQPAEEAPVE